MFFFEMLEIDRALRQLKSMCGFISEELRGWNWSNDILSPPVDNIYLAVSEIANRYCPTYRDVYLRRVLNIEAPFNYKTIRGWIYHALCKKIVEKVKSNLYREGLMSGSRLYSLILAEKNELIDKIFKEYGVEKYVDELNLEKLRVQAESLYCFLTLQASAKLDRVLSKVVKHDLESVISKLISFDVERIVNGQLLGLSSDLRIDMFADKRIIIEIKTGEIRDFHKYSVAGYALAVESDLEIPIDYGIVSYLHVDERGCVRIRNKIYFVGDELRREFIEKRDEAFRVIHSGVDPGKPHSCPDYCVYYGVCK